MALDSSALVTLPEARTFLQAESGDDPSDELLELIVGGLSDRIRQKTGDLYVNPVAKDGLSTRTNEFNPATEQLVAVDYAREIDKVEVTASPQDAGSWLEVATEDFYTEPVGQPVTTAIRFLRGVDLPAAGVGWGALSLHRAGAGADSQWSNWPSEDHVETEARATLRVTAKWGLGADTTTVPRNVKLALLMWLQNIHKRDIAFVSETIGVASATLKMPPDVEELLAGEPDLESNVGAV